MPLFVLDKWAVEFPPPCEVCINSEVQFDLEVDEFTTSELTLPEGGSLKCASVSQEGDVPVCGAKCQEEMKLRHPSVGFSTLPMINVAVLGRGVRSSDLKFM